MEAGPGAHFWAREISKLGHAARLMSPHFVKPYVKSNKNDANDRAASQFAHNLLLSRLSAETGQRREGTETPLSNPSIPKIPGATMIDFRSPDRPDSTI